MAPQPTGPPSTAALWRGVWVKVRGRLGVLLGVSLAAKLILAAAFGPLVTLLLHLGLSLSGEGVVTDLGVLSIATSPAALAGAIAAAVIGVTGWAVELVAMVAVLRGHAVGVWPAIRSALGQSRTIARLVVRLLWESLRWVGPLLLAIGVAYFALLREYDINYYLAAKPPAFWLAAAIAAAASAYAVWGVAKLLARWLAAPARVADGEMAGDVRRAIDAPAAVGRAVPLKTALAQWLAASLLLPTLLAALGGGLFAVASLWWPRSLEAVAFGLGLSLLGGWLTGLACTFLSAAALAGLASHVVEPSTPSPLGSPGRLSRRLTPGRAAALVGVGLLASALAGFAAIARVNVDADVAVIAHRGAPLLAPENTLASIEAAIAAGADWVEVDVQESADGAVVVVHDSDFMTSAGLATKVWEATADQIAEIDIGSRFGADFADERAPTLRQVLDACRGRAGLLVELKYYGHDVDLERRVVDAVEAAGMADQTRFMSLNRTGVRKLKALRPDWTVGLLLSVYVGKSSRLEADFLAMNASFVGPKTVRAAERVGREVYAWTVNDPVQMASLATAGVSGLITDDPALARKALAEWRELSPVGRLLVHLAETIDPQAEVEQ